MRTIPGEKRRWRQLDHRVWADEKYRALSWLKPSGQALWLYLILGPHATNVPGLFRATEGGLAAELRWSLNDFRRCWREIEAKGMAVADWSAGVVYLPHGVRYNAPANPSVVISWALPLSEVPHCRLKVEACAAIRAALPRDGDYPEACRRAFGDTLRDTVSGTVPEMVSGTVPDRVPDTATGTVPDIKNKNQNKNQNKKDNHQEEDVVAAGEEASSLSPTPAQFMEAWNECADFRQARQMTGKRLAALQARAKEPEWVAGWRDGLQRARRSAFCCGGGDKGWIADVDWFLRSDTLTKILEGNYDDRRPGAAGSLDRQGFFDGLRAFAEGGQRP